MEDSTRRTFLRTSGVVSIAGITGCSQITGGNDIKDTDGDGVIDSEDYAPRDASVQDAEDVGEASPDEENEINDSPDEQKEPEESESDKSDSESAEFEPFSITINGKSTFLRKASYDSPNPPPVISLDDRNIQTGTDISIEISGTIGIATDDRRRCRVVGIFSLTDNIRGINTRKRVPDAIDAGEDYESEATSNNEQRTDIPEDFGISNGQSRQECTNVETTVTVPNEANYLIIGIVDSAYSDNSGELTAEISPA